MNEFSDDRLLELLKQGEEAAFTVIYNRYSLLIYGFACRICKNEAVAEDISQDVFISLWEKRYSLSIQKNVSAYLYGAVRYRFFDFIDKQKIRADYLLSFKDYIEDGHDAIDDYVNEKDLQTLVEATIAKLPEKMKQVYVLSRKQNLSSSEISDLLHISEKTVKNQLTNALNILRKRLKEVFFFLFILFVSDIMVLIVRLL